MRGKRLEDVEQALETLSRLAHSMAGGRLRFRRKGLWRGNLVLEMRDGPTLCEILPASPLKVFGHRTVCLISGTSLDLQVDGCLRRKLLLGAGSPLYVMEKKVFSWSYLFRDREGGSLVVHRRVAPGGGCLESEGHELIWFGTALIPFRMDLSLPKRFIIDPGRTAALVILFCYEKYLAWRLGAFSSRA